MRYKVAILGLITLFVIITGCLSTDQPSTTTSTVLSSPTVTDPTGSTIKSTTTSTSPTATTTIPPKESSTVTIRITDTSGNPLNGLIAFEKGFVHKNRFIMGTLFRNGIATIEIPKIRDIPEVEWNYWGIHVYSTNHIYFPKEVEIIPGQNYEFEYPLAPDPNPDDDPIISSIEIDRSTTQTNILMGISSPSGILGPQILAINSKTKEAIVFDPPTPVQALRDNYPNGIYTAISTDTQSNPGLWYFVVADHGCSNGQLQGYPWNENIIPALSQGTVTTTTQPISGSQIEIGEQLAFRNGCTGCHYFDKESRFEDKESKTNWLLGPGLKGLLKKDKLPGSGNPATEENVKKQIREGGGGMPGFSNLSEEELTDLLAYLNSI